MRGSGSPALPTQHRSHLLQAVAFPKRQKIGLMILTIIIISNITCSNSKQDPDVFGVCGFFQSSTYSSYISILKI